MSTPLHTRIGLTTALDLYQHAARIGMRPELALLTQCAADCRVKVCEADPERVE